MVKVYLNDCPANGCIGYVFTLPTGFSGEPYTTVDQDLASCYSQTEWSTILINKDANCPAAPNQANFCNN